MEQIVAAMVFNIGFVAGQAAPDVHWRLPGR